MRHLLAALLVVSQLPLPADAVAHAALPVSIRVNVAGLGTSYAVIGSTGTLSVTRPDGTLVYRGIARTVARRDVRRVEGAAAIPRDAIAADADERLDRARALREPATRELRTVGTVYRLPDRFVFRGRGFGHGVGMSQWGAQAMAAAGASAEQILTHYYRGIALTDVGGD